MNKLPILPEKHDVGFCKRSRYLFLLVLFSISLNTIYSQASPKSAGTCPPASVAAFPGGNNQAPLDATILFDGPNLDEWTNEKGGKAEWKIKDGALTIVPGSGPIKTKMKFADCQLHVEMRATPTIHNDGQCNSIYLQERYEIQLSDSYNVSEPLNSNTGYTGKPATPRQEEWQAYDIIYTAPRFNVDGSLKAPAYVTVLHNGAVVQNHVEIKGGDISIGKSGYKKHPFKQSLLLQDCGKPVSFRNIWIREINTTILFNQTDIQGWYTYLDTLGKNNDPEKVFNVENKLLHVNGRYFGYICTEKSYSNYYLKVVFRWGLKKYKPRLNDKRDSGVLYHFSSSNKDELWPKSIECQVQEGDCGDYWCVGTMLDSPNKSETRWGMKHVLRTENFENPTGEWNTIEIICNGNQSEHYVNGHLVNSATNTSVSEGRILLQSEGAEIYYKSVELIPY